MNLDSLLMGLIEKYDDVSDVHLKPGRTPLYRQTGTLLDSDFGKLTPEHTDAVAKYLLNDQQTEKFKKGLAIDLSYVIKDKFRFRINVFRQRGTTEVTFRVIPNEVPTIEELNLPEVLGPISLEERGLVLLTGSAGCGKSTTLAAMINHANKRLKKHIITIEDPIEFVYPDIQAAVNQIEVGTDVVSFGRALRSSLREDPDIILIGEMRDQETIDTGIKAAETGHLVFSTLHTTDATKTITRLIDSFPPHAQSQVRYQVAANLKAIITQRLIRRKEGTARIPAVEVLVNTPTIQNYIVEEEKTQFIQDIIRRGKEQYGMQTIDQHLVELLQDESIDLETAMAAASNPNDFQRALQFE